MREILWELALVGGGMIFGGWVALALRAGWIARAERAALRELLAGLLVGVDRDAERPEDRRAKQVIEVWTEQASYCGLDRQLWELQRRMVTEVASVYDRTLADVRLAHAAEVVAQLLADELHPSLAILERYLTVHRAMTLNRYASAVGDFAKQYPQLGPGLKLANTLRRWGMRVYRLVSRKIPQLLFFEVAGTAAMYGAREYLATLLQTMTARVGQASIKLYAGRRVTLSEQRTVQAGLEVLLLERLARVGEAPGEPERTVIEQHAARREVAAERLVPVVAELSRLETLEEPAALAQRLERDELLDESCRRLVEMCPEGSASRQAREAFLAELAEAFAWTPPPLPESPTDAPPQQQLDAAAVLQLLWDDVKADPGPRAEVDELAFLHGADRWRLDADTDQALLLYPRLRKALWLAARAEPDALAPNKAVLLRLCRVGPCDPTAEAVVGLFRDRYDAARHSWRNRLSSTRAAHDRMTDYISDEELEVVAPDLIAPSPEA